MSHIQLSEAEFQTTIDQIIYLINEEKKTAQICGKNQNSRHFHIPRAIEIDSQEYIVTSILKGSFNNTTELSVIDFAEDSEVKMIENEAFYNSAIEILTIPKSLVELQEGWCKNMTSIREINVNPDNKYFKSLDKKFLLGKSNPENQNFDVLVLSVRDIQKVTIPNYIEIIGAYAFDQCDELRKVEFENDSKLRIIQKSAFDSTKIESIKIPSNVSKIEEGWASNTPLLNFVEVDESNPFFESIDNHYLYGKSNPDNKNFDVLIEIFGSFYSFIVPNYVEIISSHAFRGIEFFLNFEFEKDSKLRIIKKFAFDNLSISEIIIPESVVELEPGWRNNSRNLKKITVMPGNKHYASYNDTLVLAKSNPENENFDVIVDSVDIKELIIPSFVKIIGERAFYNSTRIESVIVPNDSELQIIEKYAFYRSSIECLTIPQNSKLQIIGSHAFENTRIKKLSIPSHLTKICKYAFSRCISLSQIDIPNNSELQVIEKYAFSSCSIESFTIPLSLTKIGEKAFYDCNKLSIFTIPDDSMLQTIDDYAFQNACIKEIKFPKHLKHIGRYIVSQQNIQLSDFPPDSELETIRLYALCGLIESMTIPANVKKIGEGWSSGITNLKKITVNPNNRFFRSYEDKIILGKSRQDKEDFDVLVSAVSDIEKVTIPSSVEIIKQGAFYNCKKLKEVEFHPDSRLRIIEDFAFYSTGLKMITLPSTVEELKPLWCFKANKLSKISVMENNKRYKSFEDGFLLEKSSPEKDNFDTLVSVVHNIKSITFPSFIEVIKPSLLSDCKKVTRIDFLPDSKLRIIGLNAFNFTKIKSITLPCHLKKIDQAVFGFCDRLKKINFQAGSELEEIGNASFIFSQIEHFSVPSHVKVIGKQAFYNCRKLKTIDIPLNSQISMINCQMFCDSSIESFTIPINVTRICSYAFMNCKKLRKIVIPKNSNLQIIGKCAFKETAITSFYVYPFIKRISSSAFDKCEKFQIICLDEDSDLEYIGKRMFNLCNNALIMVPNKFKNYFK